MPTLGTSPVVRVGRGGVDEAGARCLIRVLICGRQSWQPGPWFGAPPAWSTCSRTWEGCAPHSILRSRSTIFRLPRIDAAEMMGRLRVQAAPSGIGHRTVTSDRNPTATCPSVKTVTNSLTARRYATC